MKKVLCLATDGVEETELVAPVDILRRAGVEVVTASLTGRCRVMGKHGMVIEADALLADLAVPEFDALVLPGGPAVMALRKGGEAVALAKVFGEAGKPVAAICAAPLLLLDAGLLDGKRHTAHFTTRGELPRAETDQRVVVDGDLITSRGAGTALEFGLAVAAHLVGGEKSREVAEAIMA